MPAKYTALERWWCGLIGSLPCVVCRRGFPTGKTVQRHHVAEGSGIRSNFAIVPLCEDHHDGDRRGTGFHGMGTERFCKIFRVPGETEYGLLVWTLEDLALYLRSRLRVP